jgi:uncharacterized protein DUF6498
VTVKENIKRRSEKLAIDIRADRSVWLLLVSNLIVIILALVQRWSIGELLWIYWWQNVIIGFFNWRRILNLKSFSTDGFKIDGRQPEATLQTQKSTAWFFLLHYGVFHVVYCIFLISVLPKPTPDFLVHGAIGLAIFLFNHAFSYLYNREQDAAGSPNIGTIMFFPYARIVPMHLIIILGGSIGSGSMWLLFVFLLLKTVVDMLMHAISHRLGKVEL